MFKLSIKALFRNKFNLFFLILLIFLPIFTFVNEVLHPIVRSPSWLWPSIRLMEIAPIQFILLLFITIEYSRTYTHVFRETGNKSLLPKNSHLVFWSWISLEIILFFHAFLMLILFLSLIGLRYQFYMTIVWHILRVVFLYFVLLPQWAIVLGFLLSRLKHIIFCYIFSLLILLLMMPVSKEFLYQLYQGENPLFYQIFETSRIFPILDYANHAYGIAAENAIFCNVLFWLLVFLAVYFTSLYRHVRQKRLLYTSVILLSLGLGMFAIAVQPTSKYLSGSDSPYWGGGHDQLYYYKHQQPEEKSAQIDIGSIDLKFKIRRDLQAKAMLQYTSAYERIENPTFTLYHGYQVKSIYGSDNIPLPFHQESDTIYLDMPIPGKGNLTFTYQGHGHRYYSNDQGIFLPANFCYYPLPGCLRLWDVDAADMLPPLRFSKPIHYKLDVDYSGGTLYTNLNSTASNHFEGDALGLSLFAGLFREESIQGKPCLLPYNDHKASEIAASLEELKKGLDTPWKHKIKSAQWILEPPSINQIGRYDTIYLDGEQLIFKDTHCLSTYAHVYDVSPAKRRIEDLIVELSDEDLYLFEKTAEIEKAMSEAYKKEGRTDINYPQRLHLRLQKIREYWPDEDIITYLKKYIENEADKRSYIEVIDDLEKEVWK